MIKGKVMKRIRTTRFSLVFVFILISLFLYNPLLVEARKGCCSHHQGVCGNKCCDGNPLSDKCKGNSSEFGNRKTTYQDKYNRNRYDDKPEIPTEFTIIIYDQNFNIESQENNPPQKSQKASKHNYDIHLKNGEVLKVEFYWEENCQVKYVKPDSSGIAYTYKDNVKEIKEAKKNDLTHFNKE